MKDLTARQREVLDFIHLSIYGNGRPPTLREIGIALGIGSTNGVNDHLLALERKGYIKRDMATARGIRLLQNQSVNASKIDDVVEKIRYARRAHLKVGAKQVLTNEPLFLADVRRILEEAFL